MVLRREWDSKQVEDLRDSDYPHLAAIPLPMAATLLCRANVTSVLKGFRLSKDDLELLLSQLPPSKY